MLAVEANHLKARNWQKQATLALKMNQKMSQNHQNITKMSPKIDAKSMKNLGCVADAFLERFWEGLGAKSGSASVTGESHLATIFDKKSKKQWKARNRQTSAALAQTK